MAVILGVDPGSRVLGFGLVEARAGVIKHLDHGVIDVSQTNSFSQRLTEIGRQFRQLLESTRPDVIALEKIFLGKNVDSVFKLGHARGICVYEAGLRKTPIFEYEARLVKKGITGNGAATKEQVRLITFGILGIRSDSRLDASDALSIACYHARNEEIRSRFTTLKIDPPADLGEPL